MRTIKTINFENFKDAVNKTIKELSIYYGNVFPSIEDIEYFIDAEDFGFYSYYDKLGNYNTPTFLPGIMPWEGMVLDSYYKYDFTKEEKRYLKNVLHRGVNL